MERPSVFGWAFAEYLQMAGGSVLGGGQNRLHPSALTVGVSVGKNHGAVELQVVHLGGSVVAGLDGRGGHGAVHCAGQNHAAQHEVVGQPGGIGDKQFRLKSDFAAWGLAHFAEQGMAGDGAMAAGGVNPVSLPLEGVAGQFNFAPFLVGEEAGEGNGQAGLIGAGHGVHKRGLVWQRGGIALRAGDGSEGVGSRAGLLRVGGAGPDQRNQRAEDYVGADFNYDVNAKLGQGADSLAELHRLAGVSSPILAVQHCVGFNHAAGNVADQGDGRRGRLDVAKGLFQVVHHGFNQGAVESLRHVEQIDPNLLGLEAAGDGLDGGRGAADDLLEAVVHGYAQVGAVGRGVVFAEGLLYAGFGSEDGGHAAGFGSGEGVAAGQHEAQALLQAEHAGGLGRGQLAKAVSNHHVGLDADAGP